MNRVFGQKSNIGPKPKNDAKPRPRLNMSDVMARRGFERYLMAAGATKTEAMRVSAILPIHAQRAVLPAWRRLVARWRSRHG